MDKHIIPKRLLKETEVEEYPWADLTYMLTHMQTQWIDQVKTDVDRRGGLIKCKNGQTQTAGHSYTKVNPPVGK
jgi:hypothetical protein